MRELPEDRLRVTGTARRHVAADRAVWTLLVTEAGDSAAETFARCGGRLDALTAALRSAFGEGEVRTGALSVRPQHDDHGRPIERVDVVGQVVLDVALADAGRAAGAAMSAGADRLNGPALEVRDTGAIEEELLAEAFAAARRKAERLAAAAGRELGRALTVAEDSDDAPVPRLYAGRAAAFSDGPQLDPADTVVEASVTVTFALG